MLGLLLSMMRVGFDVLEEKEQTALAVSRILNTVSPPAATAAYQLNKDLAENVLSGLINHRIIRTAEILDDKNLSISKIERSSKEGFLNDFARWLFSDIQFHSITLRVKDFAKPVGRLTLSLDVRYLAERVIRSAAIILMAGIVWSGLFTLVLLYVFKIELTNPLRSLIERFHAVRLHPLESTPFPIPRSHEGDELGTLVGIINDHLAHLQETQNQLRKREERYKGLFENTEVAILDADFSAASEILSRLGPAAVRELRDDFAANARTAMALAAAVRINDVNKAALALFKAETEEAFIRGFDGIFPPGDNTLLLTAIRALSEGREALRTAATLRTFTGEEINVIVYMPVPQGEGDTHNLPISFLDVTEQRIMERLLLQSQKMEAVGHLTGGIAHDFNNLLQIILGNLDLILEDFHGGARSRDYLNNALKAGQRGAALTQQLLAFSRKQSLNPEVIDPNEIIGGMLKLLERTLGENIEISTSFEDDIFMINVDPNNLQNAILNISINAKAAMPKGGALDVSTKRRRIVQAIAVEHDELPPGDYVEVSVTDTGCGMSPETLEHAFEPFYTTKDVGEGTGLGLSMVYGFVRQSGGIVTASSEVGEGTTLTLVFPAVEAGAVATAVAREETRRIVSNEAGKGKVLVVEDDPDVRGTATKLLERLGYETQEARDAVEAMEMLAQDDSIDILFSDVLMPREITGFELAQEAVRINRNVRVLLTSGYPDIELEKSGLTGNEFKLVRKPYTNEQLYEALQAVLAGG